MAWPHLERAGIGRDLLGQMDAEHGVMAAALGGDAGGHDGPARRPAAARRPPRGRRWRGCARRRWTTSTTRSAELEPFYLEDHDHPEVVAMGREFRQRNVSKAGQFLAWVTDGATPEERASIAIPGPVFAVMTGLFGRRYRKEIAPVWRQPA